MKNTPIVKTLAVCMMLAGLSSQAVAAEGATAETLFADHVNKLTYRIGDPKAAVVFVEFQSQMCPYSKAFHLDVYPKLKEKYIDTGKVLFISIPYVHNDDDMKAMKLVQCADDQNYWPLMDEMYRERDSWTRQTKLGDITRPAVVERMAEIAADFGVDGTKAEQCLQNKELGDALIASRQYANAQFKVFRTPQYYINDRLYNELSWADVDYLMKQYLEEQGQQGEAK